MGPCPRSRKIITQKAHLLLRHEERESFPPAVRQRAHLLAVLRHRRLILGDPKDVPLQGAPTAFASLREEGKKRKTPCAIGEDKGWQKNADHP